MQITSKRHLIKAVAALGISTAALTFLAPQAFAQSTEIIYQTFLDPNNSKDPRSAAQTKMIEAFQSKILTSRSNF